MPPGALLRLLKSRVQAKLDWVRMLTPRVSVPALFSTDECTTPMRYLFQAGISSLFAVSTDKAGGNIKTFDSVLSWNLVREITETRLRCQDFEIERIVKATGYCLLDDREARPYL
jgi:hypothetical protein